jgi:hypothetical protein
MGKDLQKQSCSKGPCPGMILVYMLYLIALIVLEMIYRHEHVKVRFKSMHFFSLPSSYVLVETSGLTDGCVLM